MTPAPLPTEEIERLKTLLADAKKYRTRLGYNGQIVNALGFWLIGHAPALLAEIEAGRPRILHLEAENQRLHGDLDARDYAEQKAGRAGAERVRDTQFWRDDAFEAAATIADRYGEAAVATDIRALVRSPATTINAAIRLLWDVYHHAFHALDDGEDSHEDGTRIQQTDAERLDAALTAFETAFPMAVHGEGSADDLLAALRQATQPSDGAQELKATIKRLRGTLGYIAAQAKAGYPTVLSVILANAEAALDDDWQATFKAAEGEIRRQAAQPAGRVEFLIEAVRVWQSITPSRSASRDDALEAAWDVYAPLADDATPPASGAVDGGEG